jgi:hypothetical protein
MWLFPCDVDIIIDYSKDNINLLISTLLNFGEGSARELSYSDFDLEEGCIRIVEEFPLDVFTIMRSNTYKDLARYVKFYEINEVKIPYLSAEGIIELKKSSLRAKDQLDVQTLKVLLSNEANQSMREKSGLGVKIKKWFKSFFRNAE